ncbi:TPA: hypothetical protein ACH3X1_015644 [Trebouxia sp. C0004]
MPNRLPQNPHSLTPLIWRLNSFTWLLQFTISKCMRKKHTKEECNACALVLADFKTNTQAQDIKERGEVEEVRDVRDVLLKDDELYGTYMYINFLHRSVIHTTRCTMQRRDTLALHILNTVLHKC